MKTITRNYSNSIKIKKVIQFLMRMPELVFYIQNEKPSMSCGTSPAQLQASCSVTDEVSRNTLKYVTVEKTNINKEDME